MKSVPSHAVALAALLLGTTAAAQLAPPGQLGQATSGPVSSAPSTTIVQEVAGLQVALRRAMPLPGNSGAMRFVLAINETEGAEKYLQWIWRFRPVLVDDLGNEYSAIELSGSIGKCPENRDDARACWQTNSRDFFLLPEAGRATVIVDFAPSEDRAFPDLMAQAQTMDLTARLAVVAGNNDEPTTARLYLGGIPIPR